MKILELNFEKGWRGGERQTLYNLQGFRQASIETHLVCRKGSAMEEMATKEGFTVYAFSSIAGVIFFLLTKGRTYDFLHAQTSQILTYCAFTKFAHKAKVIFTRRVNFAQKGFFTKLKYRFTDKIVAISPTVKNTLSVFTGRTDIEVISDVVGKKNLDQNRANKILSDLKIQNKHIVGVVAALTKEKDPFTMIEAARKLSELQTNFVVIHFGSGDLLEQAKEKIKEYHLEQNYFLLGFADNVEDFFSVFDVFVMTSKEEGLGSSVLDSFINKVPVVATNAGGLNDLLNDERGVKCEVGDSHAIAQGINLILSGQSRKEDYTQKAFDYVCHNHSLEFVTEKYLHYMNSSLKHTK